MDTIFMNLNNNKKSYLNELLINLSEKNILIKV